MALKAISRTVTWILGLALLFYVGNKVTWHIRENLDAGGGLIDAYGSAWQALITTSPFISHHRIDLLAGGILTVGFALTVIYRTVGKGVRRDGEEHGSARWGGASDIAPFVGKKGHRMLYTQTESLSLESRATGRNLNSLVIGSSGSGKSRFHVIPNLFQANLNYFVTDSKGEVLAAVGPYLESQGYAIRVLNLIDPEMGDCYNPFAYFNEDRAEIDMNILISTFIANTSGRKPASSGDFWEKAERALLSAIVALVYFAKDDPSFLDVTDLVSQMGASEQDEDKKSHVDIIFENIKSIIEEVNEDRSQYTAEALRMIDGLIYAWSQYNIYLQGAGETKKSVIISLGVRLAPMYMTSIRRIMATDTLGLDGIGFGKTAIFLVTPDTHDALNFLVTMAYEQLFERNIYIADHQSGRRLPTPVHCFLDEFATIGYLPSFARKIAVIRSRGISATMLIQTYSQGKATYKDDWESIVGNCDNLLFLGGNEPSTTEYVSKRLGKQTISTVDHSTQKGSHGSWSEQYRKTGRELLTADEVGNKLAGNESIYMLRGLPPFKSRKLAPPRGMSEHYDYQPIHVDVGERMDALVWFSTPGS